MKSAKLHRIEADVLFHLDRASAGIALLDYHHEYMRCWHLHDELEDLFDKNPRTKADVKNDDKG